MQTNDAEHPSWNCTFHMFKFTTLIDFSLCKASVVHVTCHFMIHDSCHTCLNRQYCSRMQPLPPSLGNISADMSNDMMHTTTTWLDFITKETCMSNIPLQRERLRKHTLAFWKMLRSKSVWIILYEYRYWFLLIIIIYRYIHKRWCRCSSTSNWY